MSGNAMRPKVLICTVGGLPQPIATAVRENAPERVYFLCSEGSSRSCSTAVVRGATTHEARRRCPACGEDYVERTRIAPLAELAELPPRRFAIEGVADPDDLGQVLAACERIDADVGRRWPRCRPEVIANYTGGTKTMSLGLALYALHRADGSWVLQLNRLLNGGRTDLVGIRAGDQPVFQDLSRALAAAAATWAETLAGRHDYGAAVSIVAQALTHHRLRVEDQRRLLTAGLRYRLLAARDRCDYRRALALAAQNGELEAVYGPRLRVLARTVEALEDDGPWPDPGLTGLELVDEQREAAGRAAARGRFEGAAAHLVRACRLLARLRLRRLYTSRGESTGELWGEYERLASLGDPLGRYFVAHRDELRRCVGPWRDRLWGCGLVPLDRESWTAGARRLGKWLDGAQEIL